MSQQIVVKTPGDLTRYLERAKGVVAAALPKHLNPDRMLRLAVTCFSTTPKLRECTPDSILASIVVASQIGLEPGVAGQGYLIPYKGTCTFVPGWQGLVGLLNNSGRATAWTGAVFEGDEFKFALGSHPVLRHVPGENFGDVDKMQWVYACGKVNGSEQPVIEAWPVSRVWRHRDRFNKVGNRHYSYEHPEMYARKVVLLQVLKYMPRSIELNNAITAADAAEAGRTSRVDEGIVIDVGAEQMPAGAVGGNAAVDDAGNGPAGDGGGAPTLEELQNEIKAKLSKLNVGTKDFIGVLMSRNMIANPVPFPNLEQATLQAAVDSWEEIAEALKPAR